MASLPHITSRINGIKVPLLPGQAGIMHRFRNPENQLIISHVTEHGRIDSDERMVLGATPEAPAAKVSEVPTAPARKGKAKESAAPTIGAAKQAEAAAPEAPANLPESVTL